MPNSESDESGSDTDEGTSFDSKELAKPQVSWNYVANVTSIVAQHDRVKYENALALNKTLQKYAMNMKNKLQNLMMSLQEKYLENEKFMADMKLENKPSVPDYYFCGAPFFKDYSMFPAPPNEDYLERKKNGEFFPMDLHFIVQHRWTLRDKINLVQGVRKQVINYFLTKANRQETSEASETTLTNAQIQKSRLAELLQEVDDDFKIDWYRLSSEELDMTHSENECFAMWNAYLRPGLKRGEWSADEEGKLIDLAIASKFQNWQEIAEKIGNRSEYQCFVHFQTTACHKISQRNQRWTPEDDKLVLKAVEMSRVGPVIHWTKVMSFFPLKSKKQVYMRYKATLDPQINKTPFSREEDCLIMAAVQEYGEEELSCVPLSLFPGRTSTQIRSRYMNVLRHGNVQRFWTVEDDKTLLKFVEEHGTSNWVELSKILQGHSRTSCRTRYTVIQKYFRMNPGTSVEDIPRKKRKVLSGVNINNWPEKMIDLKINGDIKAQETVIRREKLKKRQSCMFKDRLRSIDRYYYDFFKYSYKITFSTATVKRAVCKENLLNLLKNCDMKCLRRKLALRHRIKTKLNGKEIDILLECCKKSKTRNRNNDELDNSNKTNLPVSWCTLLALRGLSILHGTIQTSETTYDFNNLENPALTRFQTMFESIFSGTAQLYKLNPETSNLNSLHSVESLNSAETGDNKKADEHQTRNKNKRACTENVEDTKRRKCS